MSSAIIIPSKITSTAPKPTKTQLIEALVETARKAHEKLEAEKAIKCEALKAEGIQIVLNEYKNAKAKDTDVTLYHRYRSDRKPCIEIQVITPRLKAIQKEMERNQPCIFYEEATKKKIKEGLTPANPLMNNENTEKALTQLLATIMNQSTVKAIEV